MMPRDVAGEVAAAAVPSGVGLGLLGETGLHAVVGQHAVRLESEQVRRREILRALERAAGDADAIERHRPSTQHALLEVVHHIADGLPRRSRPDAKALGGRSDVACDGRERERGSRGGRAPEEVATSVVHRGPGIEGGELPQESAPPGQVARR